MRKIFTPACIVIHLPLSQLKSLPFRSSNKNKIASASKFLFLIVLALAMGISPLKAQVTIGSNALPNAGAVLDLNNANATASTYKGVLLPQVALTSTIVYGLNTLSTALPVNGMLVYNKLAAGSGATAVVVGVYIWQAGAWNMVNMGASAGTAGGDLAGTYPNPTIASTAGTNVVSAINAGTSKVNYANMNLTNSVSTTDMSVSSVTTAKISATGTPSATTYLRGDGSWSTPSTGAIGIIANNIATQVIGSGGNSVPPTTLSFNNTILNGTVGSFDGTTFTASLAGLYLVTVTTVVSYSSSPAFIRPAIFINGNIIAYGSGLASAVMPTGTYGSGNLSMVCYFGVNDAMQIKGSNSATSFSALLSNDGTTRLAIVKLF